MRRGSLARYSLTAFALASRLFAADTAFVGPPWGYEQRAAQVEGHFSEYKRRLAGLYDRLLERTRTDDAKAYAKLKGEPPRPARHGYQLLGKLVPGGELVALQGPNRPRVSPAAYTWPWTDDLIDGQLVQVIALESRIPEVGPVDYMELVKTYLEIEPKQRWLDSHVTYNRFWQGEVRKDRARFDHMTALYENVMSRQSIQDALELKGGAFVGKGCALLGDSAPKRKSEPELRKALAAREAALSREIHKGVEGFAPPAYLKVLPSGKHEHLVEVPIYTDIRDPEFLAKMVSGLEARWAVRDGTESYAVRIRLHPLTPEALYGKEMPPKDGDAIDIEKHVAHFPKDGGVITTGGDTTYAMPGRYVVLSSGEINVNVLAHEFGHLLGFADSYFRAYHDLGRDGLEVIEILPDPLDIMCAPGNGRVLPEHFRLLMGK